MYRAPSVRRNELRPYIGLCVTDVIATWARGPREVSAMKCAALAALLLAVLGGAAPAAQPFYRAELIFPQERVHNHASCIVECPNGDLLVCWYRTDSGEKGDTVAIWGSRQPKGQTAWRPRFVMADTPGFPDGNPCMIIDPKQRLWLVWPNLLANRWESAITKYRISSDYMQKDGPPVWRWQDLVYVKPAETFQQEFSEGVDRFIARYRALIPAEGSERLESVRQAKERAADKLQQRLGWMTRAHPFVLPPNRLIVPLYSDNFSCSIMAITDDWGEHWITSRVISGAGNIQPSLVRKNDGTLVAFFRDAGPTKRIPTSESRDNGLTWSPVERLELPNPGSGLEVMRLRNGHWALICNDAETGRHSLAVLISDDEGKSWKWKRHLEQWEPDHGQASYPSLIQARDGSLHATYRYDARGGESIIHNHFISIKHAHFNEEWVMQGDPK